MMEQKINEENIENNRVFCIDHRKAFAIKSIPRSVFRNPSHKNKISLFSISVKLWFRVLYKTMTKQTVYLNNFARQIAISDSLPFKLTTFGEVLWPLQLTICGRTLHSTIKPLSNRSWIASETKELCFLADLLFLNSLLGGKEKKGIL